MSKKMPNKNTVAWCTIERIENGYLINVPAANGKNERFHKSTMNGVVKFLEHIWDQQIKADNNIEVEIPITKK